MPTKGRILALTALLLVVGYLIIPPIIALFIGAVSDTPPGVAPNFTLDSLIYAYGTSEHYESLVNSVIYAALVATLVLVLGGALAWATERTDANLRYLTDLFAIVPILMPAVLFVTGWILLLGPSSGMLNQILDDYFDLPPLFNIYSFWGMVWVGVLQELPLAFLWLWPLFRSMNPDLEDAAAVAGADRFTILRRIMIPLLRPAILAAWIIFFIYSLGALSVPILLGLPAKIVMLSTEVYLATKRIPSDLNLASAFSLMLVFATFLGIYAYRRAMVEAERFATVSGKSFNPRLIRLGRMKYVVVALVVIALFLVAGLPLIVLVWNAFMPFPQAPSLKSLELLTTKNFVAALDYGPAIRALTNSLVLGLTAGIAATVLGGFVAWCTVRLKRPRFLLDLLDQLSTVPVAMPGAIVGVSLLWLYLSLPIPIYGTMWILFLAYLTLHLPYAVRIIASGLSQIDVELEQASRVSGGTWLATLHRILIPLVGGSLFASLLYVALRSFREYAASIFLASPGNEVFSVLVLDMWDGGNSNILSAYVTMVIAGFVVLMIIYSVFSRRFGVRL